MRGLAIALLALACDDVAGLGAGEATDAGPDGLVEDDLGTTEATHPAPPPNVVMPPDACRPSADGTAALCVRFSAEPIDFEDDPDFDGSGTMVVSVYDGPDPYWSTTLAARALGARRKVRVDALPVVRFEGLPDVVYVGATFFDAESPLEAEAPDGLTPPEGGGFLGGLDLSNGLGEAAPVLPVVLRRKSGTTHVMEVRALRRFEVTARLTAHGDGDGVGPLSAYAVDGRLLHGKLRAFGVARRSIADLSHGRSTIARGAVVGPGPWYVVGYLGDLVGAFEGFPPGAIASVEKVGPAAFVPEKNRLDLGRRYTVRTSIELGFVVP